MNATKTELEVRKIAYLRGYFCTANEDGSVPLNSYALLKTDDETGESDDAAEEMVRRFNAHDALVAALYDAAQEVHESQDHNGNGFSWDMEKCNAAGCVLRRAALAAAKGK